MARYFDLDTVKEAMMSPDLIFQYATLLAVAGWVALLATPFLPRLGNAVGGYAVPAALSALYVALIFAYWMSAQGGFDSLDAVATLFDTRGMLLAGWIHYLAFDLFVGAWIVRRAAEERVPFLLIVPILGATFMFGPAGLLAFLAMRAARRAGGARSLASA
jgi:hypothetical protein